MTHGNVEYWSDRYLTAEEARRKAEAKVAELREGIAFYRSRQGEARNAALEEAAVYFDRHDEPDVAALIRAMKEG